MFTLPQSARQISASRRPASNPPAALTPQSMRHVPAAACETATFNRSASAASSSHRCQASSFRLNMILESDSSTRMKSARLSVPSRGARSVASLNIENYVKSIYQISSGHAPQADATGKLAQALGVWTGTMTSTLKTLSESGLSEYIPYEGARLTDAGRTLALRVLRRHRLIELFLARTLKMTWDEVHEEAENMEHAVSDLLIDRIDAFLGHPATDPHGDPIPKADGTVAGSTGRSLSEVRVGKRFRVVRVIDQSPDFLRYLTETGLRLDATGTVLASRPESGTITVEVGGQQTTLAHSVADRLLVT